MNPQAQRFCGRCGTHLAVRLDAPVPVAEQGERKLATVLFADVVGFTALAEVSDPERLARTVDSALRPLADVVVEHGGTIDKYLGDALMALFGVPISHDDDAERAVAAALKMRQTAGDLRFSIGINSGEVMVTSVGDGDAVTVIGDAVNVASRLESAAAAGEILVGPLTAELVAERFLLREREPAMLKGKAQPVAVYEVLGPRAGDGAAAAALPLVGREAELSFVQACSQRAAERSRAQVLVITGEAGVGKSRLAAELAARLQGESDVVTASCPGYGALVGTRLALELSTQLGAGGDGDGAPPIGFDERGVARMRMLVAEHTAQRPLLLVVDDAHNASAADLDPLVQLAARMADLPVTLLLAGRAQPGDWLTRFPGATTLHLDALLPADAVKAALAFAGDQPLTAEAAAALATQAGGNPLHLRELVRLVGSRPLGPVAGGDGRPLLPPTLRAVLAARIDGLPPGDKAVLQDVSVFSDGATAAEVGALSQDEPQAALDRLTSAGLLCCRDGRYEVEDPLLREVAYEQLPHAARGRRHRKAAAVASTAVGRARHLGLAASYLADDPALRREAAEELGRTGAELLAAAQFRDGITLAHRAVELGHADPDTLLRLAEAEIDVGRSSSALRLLDRVDAGADPRREAQVLHARGNAARVRDLAESEALLAQAAERWSELGDDGKRAWALTNRGMTLFTQGRIEDAAAAHEAALDLFRSIHDRAGAAAAAQSLALARPDDPRVPSWLDDGLRFAEETGDLTKERNALISLAWSRFIRTQLGGAPAIAEALRDAERLARVSADLGDAPFEMQGSCLVALLRRFSGDLDGAASALERARAAARAMTVPTEGLLEATEFVVGTARGSAMPPPPAAKDLTPLALVSDALVVEALLLAGEMEAAIAHLAGSALDVAPSISPFFARLAGLSRGGVLVISGRYQEAERDLRMARETARAVSAYPSEATATALLAEIEVDRGNPDGARSLLAGLPEEPGGIAGLLCDRVRALLGDAAAERRLREQAASLAAPGLSLLPVPAQSSASTK